MDYQTCKHFNGVQNGKCCADVEYGSVTPNPDKSGSYDRLPCFTQPRARSSRNVLALPVDNGPKGICPKFLLPTKEEVEGFERKSDEAIKRFLSCAIVIAEVKKEHKGKNWKGTKECPVCNGVLHMSHSAYNGHVWGSCETKDCVSWME